MIRGSNFKYRVSLRRSHCEPRFYLLSKNKAVTAKAMSTDRCQDGRFAEKQDASIKAVLALELVREEGK